MKKLVLGLTLSFTALFTFGCAHSKKGGCGEAGHKHQDGHVCQCGKETQDYKAILEAKSGSKVTGFAILEMPDSGGDLKLHYKVDGLKPNAKHGFHIHEKGDCSAKDAASAGGHWNPKGKPHGGHSHGETHAGDLGNITADAKGGAAGEVVLKGVKLDEVKNLAVIVHADADDEKSQPAGNAGARIACGIIKPF